MFSIIRNKFTNQLVKYKSTIIKTKYNYIIYSELPEKELEKYNTTDENLPSLQCKKNKKINFIHFIFID